MTDRERDHRNATLQALVLGPLVLVAVLAILWWYLFPLAALIVIAVKGH